MPRVTVIQVVYNNKRFMEPVFSAIFNQTFKDIQVVAVISGNEDGGKEFLQEKFPQVEIVDPGYNIGFAAGHNLVFSAKGHELAGPKVGLSPTNGRHHALGSASGGESEFYQLVNPDLVLEPEYIESMLQVFEDAKVGAATGKLYQVERDEIANTRGTLALRKGAPCVLDTTGVSISRSGRARDRGQHEVDEGQYDNQLIVDAVSGAGPMYRLAALQATSYKLQPHTEYFDEDFHSYWEDVDLAWRMRNKGWKCVFVPSAVGYHGRGAGSSKNGYSDVLGFIKHHKQLSPRIRQLNYKNHILMYIKNSPWLYPQFFVREFFMLGYILLFEIGTLKILPELFRQLPRIWQKRKYQQ